MQTIRMRVVDAEKSTLLLVARRFPGARFGGHLSTTPHAGIFIYCVHACISRRDFLKACPSYGPCVVPGEMREELDWT